MPGSIAYRAAVQTVPTSTDHVLAAVDGHVGWVTLNRPDKHNALSPEMLRGLATLLRAWDEDPDLRVVVIRGAGDRAFVSGADIGQLGAGIDGPGGASTHHGMVPITKPVISMIRGFCIGGGLGLALETDLRIAAADAVFGIPAGRLGVAYPLDAIERLSALVGSGEASRLLLTAERIDAAGAARIGLVHEVVAVGELEARVRALAATVAGLAPLTMRASKLGILSAVRGGRTPHRDAADQAAAACWASEDFAEGRAAFAAKRAPEWHGR